jgi:DNA-binding phage protein
VGEIGRRTSAAKPFIVGGTAEAVPLNKASGACLTEILETEDGALLASALGEIGRARGMTETAKSAGICIRRCGRGALRVSIR